MENKLFKDFKAVDEFATRHYSKEQEVVNRSKFVRDRDRILFSKEFRRLQGKTQVFVNGYDDHIRNRLTHTLEVSQIAQSISDFMGFENHLTEAIALGHDVGHTPFGHVGERVLNHLTNNCDSFKGFVVSEKSEQGFKHNWQGIKVVSTLEKIDPEYKGLNLTDYTIWGILNHSNLQYNVCEKIEQGKCQYRQNGQDCHVQQQEFSLEYYSKYQKYFNESSWTFEGLIVNQADEIAQRHHDIEDGLVAGIIDKEEMVERFLEYFDNFLTEDQKKSLLTIKGTKKMSYAVHDLSTLILRFYSNHLINNSTEKIKEFLAINQITNKEDFYKFKTDANVDFNPRDLISFDKDFKAEDKKFQKYLISRVLNSHLAQTMDGKANHILRIIIEAYLTNPKQLPDNTIISLLKNYLSEVEFAKLTKGKKDSLIAGIMRSKVDELHNSNDNKFKTQLIRTITDFIAGMTDKFAISQYRMLYGSDNYWMK